MEAQLTDLLEMQIGGLLRVHKLKLATAESCTGGLIASRVTDVPGSSDYFLGGVAAYAYEAKVALLHVSWDTLHTFGAVSRNGFGDGTRRARRRFKRILLYPSVELRDPAAACLINRSAQHGWGCRLRKANGHAFFALKEVVFKINHRRRMRRCRW